MYVSVEVTTNVIKFLTAVAEPRPFVVRSSELKNVNLIANTSVALHLGSRGLIRITAVNAAKAEELYDLLASYLESGTTGTVTGIN